MTQANIWRDVDSFITKTVCQPEPELEAALDSILQSGMPAISVSPPQGKLLNLIASIIGAKQILEIGTLAGYSTIWLAKALPTDGKLISLEVDPTYAAVAKKNIDRANLSKQVEIRVGAALETLAKLEAEGAGPFDLFFIDADKVNTPNYFLWALKLSRPGSLIIVDNVVREGQILDAQSTDINVQGTRRFYEILAKEKHVSATVIQTVSGKNYDGFALVRVLPSA